MSTLPSILCCLVIFQIIPQLLCDDTTIIPTDASKKSTDLLSSTMGVKASPTNIPLSSASPPGASVSPSGASTSSSSSSSSTAHPLDSTIKPTRAPTAAAAPGGGAPTLSLSTQPPLIHQHSTESTPSPNSTLKSSTAAEKNSTKTEKNPANSIYNHGYLTSFVILLLVGAIF